MATGTCNGVTTLSIPLDQRFDLTAFCSPLFLLCGQLGTPGLPWKGTRKRSSKSAVQLCGQLDKGLRSLSGIITSRVVWRECFWATGS